MLNTTRKSSNARTISAITNQPMNNIVTSGKQNRSTQIGYKAGVRVIYGIPYTTEEQYTSISLDQAKNTIIELCREQHRNPNFRELELHKSPYFIKYGLSLPAANEVISHCVRSSPKIGNHP